MSDKSLQHFIFHHCNIKSISKEKKYGGARHRSPYLSHAKPALYHLSYTPNDASRYIKRLIFE